MAAEVPAVHALLAEKVTETGVPRAVSAPSSVS